MTTASTTTTPNTTTTRTLSAKRSNPLTGRSPYDWAFAVIIAAGTGYAWWLYGQYLNVYETWILIGSAPSLIALAWYWRPIRTLTLAVGAASLLAVNLYLQYPPDDFGVNLDAAQEVFLLNFFLASQTAVLWMCLLLVMSSVLYWAGTFGARRFGPGNSAHVLASWLAWAGVFMGLTGSFVRWFESYQIGPGIGHIPFSNLFEVFIMFCWMTTLYVLYYEQKYKSYAFSPFAMLIVALAVGFTLWYVVDRQAHEIQPLVPALQSWWMKVHVPTNFVAYGTWAIAAMVAFAYLLKLKVDKNPEGTTAWWKLMPLWIGAALLLVEPLTFAYRGEGDYVDNFWSITFAAMLLIIGALIILRKRVVAGLPSYEVLDDLMYKAIAIGFLFFTIATILGALWAAEAWGGYWSWDPKETWSLISWLTYAAWLHMRLVKGMRGAIACWWAIAGMGVTTFTFLGVNMFLSGLHSYGAL